MTGSEGTIVFRNDYVTIHTKTLSRPDGRSHEQSVITIGTGFGVTVAPIAVVDEGPLLGVVEISRPTSDGTSAFEFPRGGSIDLGADEAFWALTRETGLDRARLTPLGTFHPENGMVSCTVAAYVAAVDAADAADADGFIDPDTGAVFSWVTPDQFLDLLTAGHVTDGITLATWALLTATSL